MEFTVDIDTGSSFTNGLVVSGERAERVKVETTPDDLSACFLNCLEEAASRFGVDLKTFLRHTRFIRSSSTAGTRCLVERSGPKLGILVSRGFEDSLYARSPEMRDRLAGVVSPQMVVGLKGETDPSGQAQQPLDENEVKDALEHLMDSGAQSLVVCL